MDSERINWAKKLVEAGVRYKEDTIESPATFHAFYITWICPYGADSILLKLSE